MHRFFALVSLVGLCSSLAGCGGDEDDSTAAGGAGAGGSIAAAGSAGASGGAGVGGSAGPGGSAGATGASGSAGASGGAAGAAGSSGDKCALPAGCTAVDKECVGWVDNSSEARPGLRMSQLSLSAPPLPTIFAGIILDSVRQKAEACNQNGQGAANWLFQFDLAAGTITTGGARSVTNPGTTPYAFLASPADDIGNLSVAPVTIEAKPDASGAFSSSMGVQLNIPLFLDDAGTDAILLPIREFVIKSGTLSGSKNCIGQYNAKGLDPQNQCAPDSTQPGFTGGATFEGFIALEDADETTIKMLNQSLCAVLTGESDGGTPKKCKRDAGFKIQSKGDWCSLTNTNADASCADAFKVSGTFAASSVKIK